MSRRKAERYQAMDRARAIRDDLAALEAKKVEAEKFAKEQERRRLAALAAAPVPTYKVLACGDAVGKLDKLFGMVETQVKKVGAFDALLCVGRSFLPEEEADMSSSIEYLQGGKKLPVEAFFIDSSPALLQAFPEGKELSPRLHFLGGYGVREVKGLRVAFLSGRYEASCYERDDADFVGGAFTAKAVRELQRRVSQDRRQRGVDVLLTAAWPMDIELKIQEESSLPSDLPDAPSWRQSAAPPIAELCRALEPRYHLFGSANLFYQRPPFQSPRGGHVCRCIGLGSVGSSSKQRKWLHALSLSPMARMKAEDLRQLPATSTPCPFMALSRKRSVNEDAAALEESASKRIRTQGEQSGFAAAQALEGLMAGNASGYLAALKSLQAAPLLIGEKEDSDDEELAKKRASSKGGAGTNSTSQQVAAAPSLPEPELTNLTEEERERRKAAEDWLAEPPADGIVRFTFDQEGPLGLRLSEDVPPKIVEVKDGSLSAKKAPRVPDNGVVIAVNGYVLAEKDMAEVIKALAKRPVILDIMWPKDKMKPSVSRA